MQHGVNDFFMSEIGNVTAEIFVTFMLFYLLTYLKMDPKGRLSSQIHFLVPFSILEESVVDPKGLYTFLDKKWCPK